MATIYRHRIAIPASVMLDIITDTEEVPENYVKAVVNAHFSTDEGNGLDVGILDGRHARLYLKTNDDGTDIKEFTVEDIEPVYGDPDVNVCTVCSAIVPDEGWGEHVRYECHGGSK